MSDADEIARIRQAFPSPDVVASWPRSDDSLVNLSFKGSDYLLSDEAVKLLDPIEACWVYYQALRQSLGRRPSRRDIRPVQMRGFHQTVYMFEADMRRPMLPDNHYYRMFGTKLATVFEAEMYHKTGAAIQNDERRWRSCAVNNLILEIDAPVIVHGEFQAIRENTLYAQFLALPLEPIDDHMRQVFGASEFVYQESQKAFF